MTSFLSLIGLVYHYRLQQLRKEQIIRQQIADDLHDDIGNKLNLIGIFSQKANQLIEGRHLSEAQFTLDKLSAASRETLRTFHHMLWSIDPQKDALVNLTNRMQDFTDDYLLPLSIPYDFVRPAAMLNRHLDQKVRYHVIHIYQELLTNMIKHTHMLRLSVTIRITDYDGLEITLVNHYKEESSASYHTVSTQRGQHSLTRRLDQINGRITQSDYFEGSQKTVIFVPNAFKGY